MIQPTKTDKRRRQPRVVELSPLQREIVESIRNGKRLTGEGGVLTALLKGALEEALSGEMEAHLATNCGGSMGQDGEADSYSANPNEPLQPNRRNGHGRKTVHSDYGAFELSTPRDRHASFAPEIVKKRQTVLTDELDSKILALYGLGMSYEDISGHVQDMYGYEASTATISAVTDKLLPVIAEWRSRPLEAVYPIVFLDAMFFKTRVDGKVVTKVLYNSGDRQGRTQGYSGLLCC